MINCTILFFFFKFEVWKQDVGKSYNIEKVKKKNLCFFYYLLLLHFVVVPLKIGLLIKIEFDNYKINKKIKTKLITNMLLHYIYYLKPKK